MSTQHIIEELRKENVRIQIAIDALEGGVSVSGKASTRRARTPEQKAAQSAKMKIYWASRKAGTKKSKRK